MAEPIYRFAKEDLFVRATDTRPAVPRGRQVRVLRMYGTHPKFGDDYDIECGGRIYSCYAAWLSRQPVLPDAPLPSTALTVGKRVEPGELRERAVEVRGRGIYDRD